MKKFGGYWFPKGGGTSPDYYLRHMDDSEAAMSWVTSFDVAVQAGGHVGLWGLTLARRFEFVITFEPEAQNFRALCRNVRKTRNIRAVNAALSEVTGSTGLRFNKGNSGGHHLVAGDGVRAIALDDLALQNVGGIFLDVEGHELSARKGSYATILRSRPVVMIEAKDHGRKAGSTPEPVRQWLESVGYKKVSSIAHDERWAFKNDAHSAKANRADFEHEK